ncbi:MAG TPA: hypothetical protein VFA26_01595, partial [Gemmataceae bacterium]|nr:hypothetical protein [Gemmataceae bacterium]
EEMVKSDPTKAMLDWQKKQGGKGKPRGKRAVPAAYTSEKNTPLKWTVESGGPRVELKLKKA